MAGRVGQCAVIEGFWSSGLCVLGIASLRPRVAEVYARAQPVTPDTE